MNKLAELIKKLHAEGKSYDEIAAAVILAKDEAGKSITDGKSTEEVVTEVRDTIKTMELAKAIRDNEAKEKAATDEDARIRKSVDDYLKSQPANQPEQKKEINMFSTVSGKWESSKKLSEPSKAFNDLVVAVALKDAASMVKIGRDIEIEKVKDYKAMGFTDKFIDSMKALYSDATTGSYMIPTEVEGMIFERAWQSAILSRVNTRAITYNTKLYPVM